MVCNAGVFTPEFQETDVIVAEKKNLPLNAGLLEIKGTFNI
jgi:hypothetical protein